MKSTFTMALVAFGLACLLSRDVHAGTLNRNLGGVGVRYFKAFSPSGYHVSNLPQDYYEDGTCAPGSQCYLHRLMRQVSDLRRQRGAARQRQIQDLFRLSGAQSNAEMSGGAIDGE